MKFQHHSGIFHTCRSETAFFGSAIIIYLALVIIIPPHTSGSIPVIRCPKGNAAEMVAMGLDKKIRDNLRDPRSSMFTGDNMAQIRSGWCVHTLCVPQFCAYDANVLGMTRKFSN